MKGLLFFGLFVLSVLGARSFLSPKQQPLPKFNYLSCQGEVDEMNVKYRSELFLVKRALPAVVSDEMLWAAVWRNNNYPFFNQPKISPSVAKSIGLGPETIHILSKEDAPYPNSVKISSGLPKQVFPDFDAEYVKNLFSLGSVKKGEPAMKVSYEVNQTIYTCHVKGADFHPEKLKLYAPNDPYLAKDFFPAEDYPLISIPRDKAFERINPCFEVDQVRATKPVNPLSFGYGWNPFLEGHSADKKSFSCRPYYRPGENIFLLSQTVTKKEPVNVSSLDFGRLKNLNRPIRASVFFGASDNYSFSKLDPEEAKAYIDMYLSDISTSEARENIPIFKGKYDKTFSRLLIFLRNMKTFVTTHTYEVVATPEVVQVKFQGKFKQSKKDIEVFVHFSPNIPENTTYELFGYAFASKFLSSDIVVYDGHSAGGKTLLMGMELASKSVGRLKDDSFPPYQILGVLSCSANGVYNLSRIPKVKGMDRDIVYGLSSFSDPAANGALSFIIAADKYLYNQSVPHFGHWASYFRTDNHLLLMNQR